MGMNAYTYLAILGLVLLAGFLVARNPKSTHFYVD